MLKHTLYILVFISSFTLNAQDCWQKPTGDSKLANDYFSYGYYPCALREFLMIYSGKPQNKKVNRKIAQCYLNSPGGNKALAIKHLEFLVKAGKPDDDVYLELGQAYLFNQEFDKALQYFEKYITSGNPKGESLNLVEKLKENAKVSKELIKFPVNVKFDNLGDDVNGVYNEMHPFLTDEEDFIMLTSDRKGVRGGIEFGDGYVTDVMLTKVKNGRDAYKGARSLSGTFSTEFAEKVAGGSPNGEYFFYCTDEQFQQFDLKITNKPPKKRSYSSPEFLEGVNGRNSNEMAATVTNDGTLIIFSSDRKGGFGGLDLWMSKKLPNNTWGTAINLGPSINTAEDESFPNFSYDQSFITFASKGHKGMGGYDLFKTEFSTELKTWTKPKNLGYPVNTANDDYTIVFVKNGRYAYKSDIRTGGYGMRDLYKLTFNDVLPTYTVVKSAVLSDTLIDLVKITDPITLNAMAIKKNLDSLTAVQGDSLTIDSLKQIYYAELGKLDAYDINSSTFIEVINEEGSVYGQYTPNSRNGKFIMILEPGVYTVSVANDGFQSSETKIRIYDKSNYTPEFSKSFYLKPKANL